jgi:hypothetical protein
MECNVDEHDVGNCCQRIDRATMQTVVYRNPPSGYIVEQGPIVDNDIKGVNVTTDSHPLAIRYA